MGKRTKEEQLAINAKAKATKAKNLKSKQAVKVEETKVVPISWQDSVISLMGDSVRILVITANTPTSSAMYKDFLNIAAKKGFTYLERSHNNELHISGETVLVFRCKNKMEDKPDYKDGFNKVIII